MLLNPVPAMLGGVYFTFVTPSIYVQNISKSIKPISFILARALFLAQEIK